MEYKDINGEAICHGQPVYVWDNSNREIKLLEFITVAEKFGLPAYWVKNADGKLCFFRNCSKNYPAKITNEYEFRKFSAMTVRLKDCDIEFQDVDCKTDNDGALLVVIRVPVEDVDILCKDGVWRCAGDTFNQLKE